MLQWTQTQGFRWIRRGATVLFVLTMAAGICQTAFAMWEIGKGNSPIADPGWPKGAAAVFNNPNRISYGRHGFGGLYMANFCGDAEAFNAFLADYAKVDAKTKRLVVHDGVQHGFWEEGADWAFTVWAPADRLPLPREIENIKEFPPPQINVYAGGNVHWSDVIVPEGIELSDERLDAHGFTPADGVVLEGKVVDLATNRPVAGRMRLDRIEQDKGETHYTTVAEATADAQGRWFLKNTPKGWYRVVVDADGYVPRWVGNPIWRSDSVQPPGWYPYNCGLSRAVPVSGRALDEAGKPLMDVEVQLEGCYGSTLGYFTQGYTSKTDADGRFHIDQVPAGTATIQVRRSGYWLPGGQLSITAPAEDVALKMMIAAQFRVTVDFAEASPHVEYYVKVEPEDKAAAGAWHGWKRIDRDNRVFFDAVPPGKYVMRGHPVGSSAESYPLAIELKSGETAEITLPAK